MKLLTLSCISIVLLPLQIPAHADPDDRQDRGQERGRSDERQDKRDCKQEEVRDGMRGKQGERFGDDDDD
jgi:hypothetical protein